MGRAMVYFAWLRVRSRIYCGRVRGRVQESGYRTLGDRPKKNADYSRIINAREVKRLASLIDPRKVVTGGNYDEKERYFDPTILYPVDWSDKIMQDEIFGPILPVLRYSNFRDAIATIKARPRPLAGFIFSQNQTTIDTFISSFSFGG